MPEFDLQGWCGGIPQLAQAGPGLWQIGAQSEVSFPAAGHSSIAEVEHASFWFRHRNNVITSVVRQFPPSGPIFDIGGGNGFVSLGLREAGFDAVVIEPGAKGAQTAEGRGLPVIQAPFQDLAIPAGSMPSAGLFDVLEHIEDDRGALQRLYSALAPGGRLYIAVPAYNWLWSVEDAHAGHFRRYVLGGLRQRLIQAGFEVEYGTYFFGLLIPPLLLLRTLPSLLGLAKVSENEAVAQDHGLPAGIIGRVFQRSFAKELAQIQAGGAVKYGTSCLAVARKPS